MRMEVIAMAIVAILVAVGVIALIYLGLFVVVWGAFLVMFAVDKTDARRRRGVHSGH